jgi:hypothetical protein
MQRGHARDAATWALGHGSAVKVDRFDTHAVGQDPSTTPMGKPLIRLPPEKVKGRICTAAAYWGDPILSLTLSMPCYANGCHCGCLSAGSS